MTTTTIPTPTLTTIPAVPPSHKAQRGYWSRWAALLDRLVRRGAQTGRTAQDVITPALTPSEQSSLRSAARSRGVSLRLCNWPKRQPVSTAVWLEGGFRRYDMRKRLRRMAKKTKDL